MNDSTYVLEGYRSVNPLLFGISPKAKAVKGFKTWDHQKKTYTFKGSKAKPRDRDLQMQRVRENWENRPGAHHSKKVPGVPTRS